MTLSTGVFLNFSNSCILVRLAMFKCLWHTMLELSQYGCSHSPLKFVLSCKFSLIWPRVPFTSQLGLDNAFVIFTFALYLGLYLAVSVTDSLKVWATNWKKCDDKSLNKEKTQVKQITWRVNGKSMHLRSDPNWLDSKSWLHRLLHVCP